MRNYLEVFIALMPLFAGLTLVAVPFAYLNILFGAAALMLLSILPALSITDTHERFSWSYGYTFRQLFRSKHSGFVFQSLLEGLQGAALFLAWPIVIFIILERSYLDLGFVFSMTLLFILLFRRAYRWAVRAFGLEDSVAVQSEPGRGSTFSLFIPQ